MESALSWQSATPMPSAKQRNDPDWERKQRNREYRVAARREKRNRKADEKKQRKLNATILRRMTRNPEKYSKNAERNKTRAIDVERRTIWQEAIRQAERLAAKHDPSGRMFNVGPVVVQEDGTVISEEVLSRREERRKEKEAKALEASTTKEDKEAKRIQEALAKLPADLLVPKGVNPEKYRMLVAQQQQTRRTEDGGLSRNQQKKLEKYAPRPIPPKPVLPAGIETLEGETNWIELWDISDSELERRVNREKKKKQLERKNLRLKQQAGKRERRAARDEKRRVYRDLKETWKLIKAREKRHKVIMRSHEDREAKQIAVELNDFERKRALELCAGLGFTLENTEGVDEIKPIVRGTKGENIDWDNLHIGEGNDIRPKDEEGQSNMRSRRVDLSKIAKDNQLHYIGAGGGMDVDDIQFEGDADDDDDDDGEDEEDALAANHDEIRLDVGDGDAHEAVNFNHKMRKKIRRALENQRIQKEILVRNRAIKHYEDKGEPVPDVLRTSTKPVHEQRRSLLENGTLETSKQQRIRQRVDLAEFNNAAKVLRRQAKAHALEAGLRIYAELTGRISRSAETRREPWEGGYGPGWHIPPKPNPEDLLREEHLRQAQTDGAATDSMNVDDEDDGGFVLHGVRF